MDGTIPVTVSGDPVSSSFTPSRRGFRFNIETKVEAGAPQETAPREQFVEVAVREIKAADMQHRVSSRALTGDHCAW
jgi:hypothetical protein